MGKKSPPPEPDYTNERAAFATSELARRQTQADAYNKAINSYNADLSSLNSQLNELGSTLSGYSIVDDEHFGGATSKIASLEDRLAGLQSNLGVSAAKPNWTSMVQSAYGPVEVGMPSLVEKNTGLANSFSAKLGELGTMIAGLRDERAAEEKRIDTFSSGLAGTLAGLTSQADQFTISDKGGITSSLGQLADLDSQLTTFSSPILSEYRSGDVGRYQTQIDALQTSLNDILGQRATEEQRIRDFEGTLNANFDVLNDRFGNLTISDLAGIEALQRDIDARQLGATRFSSVLPTTFNDELSAYADLEARLGSLVSERDAELARVATAEQEARSGASSLMAQLASSDIYSGSLLGQIENAINEGRSDIAGFSSALGGDFAGVLGQLDQADAQLAALRAARQDQLSGFGTDASSLMDKIGSADLADESRLRSNLNAAQQLSARLGQYSGTDVLDYRNQIRDAVDAAQGRLDELGTVRSGIEGDARRLLSQARTTDYTSADMLDALAAELSGVSDQQANYGATQAVDEIDAIAAVIANERARLKADEEAALARQEEEQAAFAGFNGFGRPPTGFSALMTQYAPWFNADLYRSSSALPSSFARQLAVQYA